MILGLYTSSWELPNTTIGHVLGMCTFMAIMIMFDVQQTPLSESSNQLTYAESICVQFSHVVRLDD